ncbi:beta strand repeat-containing protein [Flagellimonas sp.]|uniref:beta strand repeat-containing protein n=1 Tax=Flagellimonas sp. TaxID=2058762 RepID=UPI003BB08D84
MKKQFSSLIIGLLMICSLQAQIKIGENPEVLHPASVLELESTSRVLVITRMNTVQMESITPLQGAMVYNVDTECVHFFDGTQWINPCDQPDEQTFSTDPIVNANPTIVITEDGTNFNFEVGMIRGENIVPTSVNGQLHIQPQSITGDRIAAEAISFDKLGPGTTTGELLQWSGTQWILVDESALTVTEVDGVVGNEVTGPADATLVLSGTGDALNPFLLDVNAGGINTVELADNAVNSLKIADGQVSNLDLATDAVTNDKMANNAVGTNEIIDGNVTDAKLDKANIPLSGFGPATANVSMGGFQINNLQDPTVAQDAATMAYVDAEITASNAADGDTDSNNENQTVSAGAGINVAQVGQDFQVTNSAPDQTVTLADGGSGNVTIGGTYPNLTVDVASLNDADSDPNNENQTVSAGTGINVAQVGQDFQVTNSAPDQTVTLADGGSGNVTIGGTYPNLTVDVASLNDADSDPNNENQTVSAGAGINVAQVGQDFQVTNSAPDQTVTLADGGSGNVTIGGTYPNLTVDVASLNDADSDPNNENQTVSAGTGINVAQVGQDFQVTNSAPDQTVTLADGGSGNVTIGGTYPNLTVDVASLNDADSDPNNENQTVSAGAGINVAQIGQDFQVSVLNPVIAMGRIASGVTTSLTGATFVNNTGGSYTINLSSTPTDYVVQLSVNSTVGNVRTIQVTNHGAASFNVQIYDATGVAADSDWYFTVLSF